MEVVGATGALELFTDGALGIELVDDVLPLIGGGESVRIGEHEVFDGNLDGGLAAEGSGDVEDARGGAETAVVVVVVVEPLVEVGVQGSFAGGRRCKEV